MTAGIALLLQAGLIAAAAPLLAGILALAAARWRGAANGPALTQPGRDLVRLWRKGTMLPAGASLLFGLVPALSLAAAATAALLVPGFTTGLLTAPLADLVVVAALLAGSRAVVALAAWDAGSALGTHRAGQAMAVGRGAAPVVLLVALALLLASGGTNLDAAAAALRDGSPGLRGVGMLAAAALFALVLTERADGMEPWSGRGRAALVLAAQLRLVAALSLAAMLCPFGMAAAPEGWAVGLACWMLKLLVLGLLATAIGPARLALPVAALFALMAVVLASLQGNA